MHNFYEWPILLMRLLPFHCVMNFSMRFKIPDSCFYPTISFNIKTSAKITSSFFLPSVGSPTNTYNPIIAIMQPIKISFSLTKGFLAQPFKFRPPRPPRPPRHLPRLEPSRPDREEDRTGANFSYTYSYKSKVRCW